MRIGVCMCIYVSQRGTTDDMPMLSTSNGILKKAPTPPLTARQKAEQVEAAMTLSSQLDDDASDSDDDFFDIKKNSKQQQQQQQDQQSSTGISSITSIVLIDTVDALEYNYCIICFSMLLILPPAMLSHNNANAGNLAEGSIDTSQDNYGDTATPTATASSALARPASHSTNDKLKQSTPATKKVVTDDDDVLDESYGLGDDFEVDELDS
eukprot:18080-Heterococcus_DN1.PRE.2